MNASNMKQSLSTCQQDYTNKRTSSQYICSIIHSNTFIHKPTVLRKGSTYFVSSTLATMCLDTFLQCASTPCPYSHQPGDEMYNPYSPSCHQPDDEMYNPYSNIIWQLATHATNQVKKELIFVPPTR